MKWVLGIGDMNINTGTLCHGGKAVEVIARYRHLHINIETVWNGRRVDQLTLWSLESPKIVITAAADGPAPNGARPSAATVMTPFAVYDDDKAVTLTIFRVSE